MDTREKLTDARVGMLALADELKNISRACQVAGISRTHFSDIKDAFERYGRDGLAPRERRRPRMPNETAPELVARILEMTAEYPTYSYVRVSQQLRLIGVPASAAQVRGVWAREGLVKRFDRLLWLERRVAERGGPLTETVLKLLRQHAQQTLDPQGQIEAPVPGYLGWTPCIGPILGAILGLATVETDVWRGMGLLAAYSAGLAVPFLIAALAVDHFLDWFQSFRQYIPWVMRISGVMLIFVGVLMVTGNFTRMAGWLQSLTPDFLRARI